MNALPILSLLTFLPLIGALGLLFLPCGKGDEKQTALVRKAALAAATLTFALALYVLYQFDPADKNFQFVELFPWLPQFGLVYHRGIDGISIWFVMLAALLTPLAMLSARESVQKRVKDFMIALLLLETMMIGTFTALDLVLFYVFFEGVLIPMFLVIGVWGGDKRVYAAQKFFIYTFCGSVLMLVAIAAMIAYAGTSDMTEMLGDKFPKDMALWLWLAFFASFAVKTPMWPFHTWLPYAHGEAPAAGSAILAGLLLKMGGYGFIRISLQILPEASAYYAPYVTTLSLIAIVYALLVALAQTDIKRLIAYTSIAHMGYVTLALFSFNQTAFDGAMLIMLSHGVVSAALFLGVGVVYDRTHTREIKRYGGVATVMPRYAILFMLFTLASIGLPGTSGFVGEFLALQGVYLTNTIPAGIATLGTVLGAAVMLWLYGRVFFGVVDQDEIKAMKDIGLREAAMLLPLAVLILWMGVHPATFSRLFTTSTTQIMADFMAVTGGHI